MKRRLLVTLAALLLSVLSGAALGTRSPYAAAQATTPAPDHLTAAPIVHAGVNPQAWMPAPFCVTVWFDAVQCAEHKGDELRIGAGWKLDLPTPAWLALVGKRPDGVWLLSAVAKDKDDDEWPAPGYVAVDGPTLVQVVVNATSTASPSPSGTVAPPPNGATATSTTVAGSTLTPSPPGRTPTPTRPIVTITPTPMFPEIPNCTTQIVIYLAGEPAQGGLGGRIGDVIWCDACNSGCGMWLFGVDEATMDGWTNDANRRVRELWATATVRAR